MTDTLLPAAPEPLEKEGDAYFRKVGGLGQAGSLWTADHLSPRLWKELRERVAGGERARRGRGRAGLGRDRRRLGGRGAAVVYPAAGSRGLPGLGGARGLPAQVQAKDVARRVRLGKG